MNPLVIFNEIPFSDDIQHSIPNTVINSEGRQFQKDYNAMNIEKTKDGENPWVTIVCTPNGVIIEKNF